MSKGTSNTRKMKRSKPAKSFAEQAKQETEERKKRLSKMPLWKKIGGILLLPIMLAFWFVDRALFLLMPHSQHPSLKQYLLEKSSMKMTIARLVIFGIPATIVWLLM